MITYWIILSSLSLSVCLSVYRRKTEVTSLPGFKETLIKYGQMLFGLVFFLC